MKKTLEINISKKDFALLEKYGFYFEKNIEEYLKDIANEVRQAEKEATR